MQAHTLFAASSILLGVLGGPGLAQVPAGGGGPVEAGPAAGSGERIRVGEAAPDFTLAASDGSTHRLSELRGGKNLVLVFFRGTW